MLESEGSPILNYFNLFFIYTNEYTSFEVRSEYIEKLRKIQKEKGKMFGNKGKIFSYNKNFKN